MSELALRLKKNVVFRAIDDEEGCLLDVETQRFFALNATGSFIVGAIEERATLEQIITQLEQRFGINRKRCRADTTAFVDELRKACLLE